MTLESDALAIARAGIRSADPARSVARWFRRRPGGFRVGRTFLPVPRDARLHVLAIGKAAGAMADAAARIGGRELDGLVVTPRGYPGPRCDLPVRYGRHPVPGPESLAAGRALLAHVRSTRPDDAVLFLISGGGSAVAESPEAPLSLGEVARATEVLLASGAPIGEMNALRRHLSEIKGGRLLQATVARRRATIAISDVVGDAPENIASGPTVPDPTTFAQAEAVIRRYALGRALPAGVVRWVRDGARGRHPETPKPGDPAFRGVPFALAATNRTAVAAAAAAARERGYRVRILARPIVGETRPAAERFARQLNSSRKRAGRSACIGGGETTVTLGPRPGRGGRNQEFALAAARPIEGRARSLVLSIGTDGIDGPTDAAGGWVDDHTARRAREVGIDLERVLRRHAAYDALVRLGALVRTGPTGTNVTDLHVGLSAPAISRGTGRSSPRSAAPSSRRRRS